MILQLIESGFEDLVVYVELAVQGVLKLWMSCAAEVGSRKRRNAES